MSFSPTQFQALVIIPKFTSFLSVTCSVFLGYIITANPRKKDKSTPYHRLVLGLGVCDALSSFAWFFTTWPIPSSTGIWGASGNQQTCSLQGFFTQFSLAAVFYNGSLAIYYVLVIVKNWPNTRLTRIEPYFHVASIGTGLVTSTASLALGILNPVGWDCWIGAAPMGCIESYRAKDGNGTCVRGDNASLYAWFFFYAPLWIVIVMITLSMIWVYKFIKNLDKRTRSYSFDTSQSNRRRKLFAKRAMLYVGACYATWFFPTILQLVIAITGKVPFGILLPTATVIPCQGVLNIMVYLSPDYERYRIYNKSERKIVAKFKTLLIELGVLEYNEAEAIARTKAEAAERIKAGCTENNAVEAQNKPEVDDDLER